MKTIIALTLLALVTAGTAAAEPATALPWTTMSDLKQHVTEAFVLAGCADTRPMGLLVVVDGPETYVLVVNADARWAIMQRADTEGETRIWYGSVLDEGRLLIERAFVGTLDTDVCPLLTRQPA